MRRFLGLTLVGVGIAIAALSCNGTTGDELVTFAAYASGVPGASQPFTAGSYTIELTAAKMHIGAVYFDEAPPGTGFDGPVCIASGVFAAQVPGPLIGNPTVGAGELDLLSSAPQEFEVYGNGTADSALSWQLWLTDGDVNEVNFTHIVDLEGIATGPDGKSVSFGAAVTINSNRSRGSSDPAQPGLNPLCKSRIVQIGNIDLPFFQGGALYVTVDPRLWFTQLVVPVDFAPGQLPLVTDPNCLTLDTASPMEPQGYALTPETPPPSSQVCGGSGQPCCTVGPADTGASPCLGALTCTSGVCGPTYCIPNSSFLSGADPGASAGVDLFTEITSAAAFSVRYVRAP